MSHSTRIRMACILMVFATLACNIASTPPSPNTGLLGTIVAQTIIASLTMNAPAAATLTPSAPPQATNIAVTDTPSLTPTQTLTPTASATFTALVAQISVSVPTNCRTGPGKTYPMVGALMVGETVQVYGRDPTGHYWYIRNPDKKNGFCWVWDEYATLTGNIGAVPVFTPPPTMTPTRTPTPTATFTVVPGANFTASYAGLESCKAKKKWWVQLALKNTGSVPLRFMTLVVVDIKKNLTLSITSNGFNIASGCGSVVHLGMLLPGNFTITSSQQFPNNLNGRELQAWITLCTQPNHGGICVQKTLSFTP